MKLPRFINRVEIFHLYQFDTCIIDEASQILEPSLVGLLPQYGRFIMIGDHKQLPAVVVQHPNDTIIQNEDLQSLGFSSTSMSLFERLYLRCKSMDWIHAYGILTAQGRMHEDLMAFPNKFFYEGRLKLIKGLEKLHSDDEWNNSKSKPNILIQNRITYIPTKVDEEFSWKTNTDEAKECIRIINSFFRLYKEHNKEWHNGSLGVITPYRAQIALISQKIEEEVDPSIKNKITVDTVERYQGGARDIIIISLCTNKMDQLERLVSMSYEGVDRKLNVALTRARERIFILGHEEILQSNKNYSELINHTRNSSSSSS